MPIPSRKSIKADLLALLKVRKSVSPQQAYQVLARKWDLTDRDKKKKDRSGELLYQHLIRFARQDLVDDGLITDTKRSGRAIWTLKAGTYRRTAQRADTTSDNAAAYYDQLEKDVSKSRRNSAARRKRLKRAPKKPVSFTATSTLFKRNPDVIAEVLERASGYCEGCGKRAPFRRARDGSHYLEIHHRVPLAEDGDDTIENALGLCPNCHRKAHFG